MTANPDGRTKVLEIVCKDYSQLNEDAYFCIIFDINTKCIIEVRKLSKVLVAILLFVFVGAKIPVQSMVEVHL
ncbi:MAG: hypothetical protein CM15mV81_240 [uncultured marine virus]|nr:MAG: hypothetical protein CM15mV81_240 [uncultured marine virus]